MSDAALLDALPDLVAFLRPDGLVLHARGGRRLPFLQGAATLEGRRLEELVDAPTAELLRRLAHRAVTDRSACEADFLLTGESYHVRVSAQGPRRALCVIRHVSGAPPLAAAGAPAARTRFEQRRGFMRRLRRSVADAHLRERPLALCVILLDGLTDVGRLIDFSISERILGEVLERLPDGANDASGGGKTLAGAEAEAADGGDCYIGRLGESMLGAVIEGCTDRDRLRLIATTLSDAIARPVPVHDAQFHLAPYVGIAMLDEDAVRTEALLDHARAAMLEARRSAAGSIRFYSDTLNMLPVARLDIERELRRAIEEGQIGLHYVARHDLTGGRLTGIHAYMRWIHPLQGEIPPAHFLPIANATGLAIGVSCASLERLLQDLPALRARHGEDVAVSFGPLRQHVASGELLRDCRSVAKSLPAGLGRFELRIAERTLANMTRPERAFAEMAELGAGLVVDEVGRDFSSFATLARLPVSGLQVDRALVVAAQRDAAALRSCRAVAALAGALDVIPIATGIDTREICALMSRIGYAQGLGDLNPTFGAALAMHSPPSGGVAHKLLTR
jgi:predicted signal transduction protein with EAL and GGDEF domain